MPASVLAHIQCTDWQNSLFWGACLTVGQLTTHQISVKLSTEQCELRRQTVIWKMTCLREGESWTYEEASCPLNEIPWVRSVNAWGKALQVETLARQTQWGWRRWAPVGGRIPSLHHYSPLAFVPSWSAKLSGVGDHGSNTVPFCISHSYSLRYLVYLRLCLQ